MSIYSGFSTRKEEDKYNKLLGRLITTLQNHILELTSGNIGLSYFTQYSNITTKL